MEVLLPYGSSMLPIQLDVDARNVVMLNPKHAALDPVYQAMAAPIGSPPLREMVSPGQSVAIIISDVTRPCPSYLLLPPLVQELNAAGIADQDILVVSALGSHRPQTNQERTQLIGQEMAYRLRCIDSDPNNVTHVGTTTRGTPIEAFIPVVEADFRIGTGNVEPHYFAGYSGGAKALIPGVCSRQTIQKNHAMMVEAGAQIGVIDGNPVREDIEEGAALIGLDFILNVILDDQKNIITAAAGDFISAHRWACRVLDFRSKVIIENPADIVIVSAGGFPKDINLYQAQKALENAVTVVKPGGQIIWVAECREGFGHNTFQEWFVGMDATAILARIRREFVLGGHKAAAIARALQKARDQSRQPTPTRSRSRLWHDPVLERRRCLGSGLAICTARSKSSNYARRHGCTTVPKMINQEEE